MTPPPAYPRVAHLVGGRGTRDDLVLGQGDREAVLGGPVAIEEKLDGANVVMWVCDHVVQVALRSGVAASDRAGQLGPLRAWVGEHADELRSLLGNGEALYAEWLLLTHSMAYDRLPAYLMAIDLWHHQGGFAGVDERNRRCDAAGIARAPGRWRGTPGTVELIEAQFGPSAVGSDDVEGLVIRTLDGGAPRLAKLLRPGFERIDDEAWASGRPRNQLVDREASWH